MYCDNCVCGGGQCGGRKIKILVGDNIFFSKPRDFLYIQYYLSCDEKLRYQSFCKDKPQPLLILSLLSLDFPNSVILCPVIFDKKKQYMFILL